VLHKRSATYSALFAVQHRGFPLQTSACEANQRRREPLLSLAAERGRVATQNRQPEKRSVTASSD
jgi:hypothetical protein